MQRDTFFIAPIAAALFGVVAAAIVTLSSPVVVAQQPRTAAATAAPIAVTLPTVVITGKRETRVAAGEPTSTNRVQ